MNKKRKRETKLPEGYRAQFTFERFSRAEAKDARVALRSGQFEPATAAREAWRTCALYPLGHLRPGAVSAWGGRTVCNIVIGEDDAVIAVGEADCSLSDRFDADLGAMIALGRAVKVLHRP